jgi:hypothetical protein
LEFSTIHKFSKGGSCDQHTGTVGPGKFSENGNAAGVQEVVKVWGPVHVLIEPAQIDLM